MNEKNVKNLLNKKCSCKCYGDITDVNAQVRLCFIKKVLFKY